MEKSGHSALQQPRVTWYMYRTSFGDKDILLNLKKIRENFSVPLNYMSLIKPREISIRISLLQILRSFPWHKHQLLNELLERGSVCLSLFICLWFYGHTHVVWVICADFFIEDVKTIFKLISNSRHHHGQHRRKGMTFSAGWECAVLVCVQSDIICTQTIFTII